MSVEFLGLPGAGKSKYLKKLKKEGSFFSKTDLAEFISLKVLKDDMLEHGLQLPKLSEHLGMVRLTAVKLSKTDKELRKETGEAVNRILDSDAARSFLQTDFYEMFDSLYREILFAKYSKRESIYFVNENGAVQSILSIIGLRNYDESDEKKKEVCRVIASEIIHMEKIFVFNTPPDKALIECMNRSSGVPELFKEDSHSKLKQRFHKAFESMNIITEYFKQNGIEVENIET